MVREHFPNTSWLLTTICLLVVPCFMFPGALPGPRVVSLDDHLSVHHAFQSQPGGTVHNPVLSDPAVQLKAIHRRVVRALSQGKVPLWNPDIYCGTPLLADGQTMLGSPVIWFRLVLPENQAQDAGIWWLLVWSGLGTLLLLKSLDTGPAGALTAAILTMTGPFFAVWLHYPLAGSYVWIPWVILGVEHLAQGGSSLRLALAVTAMVAGGHPDPALYGIVLAGLWAVHRHRLGAAAVGILIGLCLAAPFWGPLVEQVARSPLLEARPGSRLEPAQLLDLVWPGWFGHPAAGGYRGPGVWEDGVIHPGLVAYLLLPLALKRSGARSLALLWLAAVAASVMGMPGPLHHARLAQYAAWLLALAAGMAVQEVPGYLRWGVPLLALVAGVWVRQPDLHTLDASQHNPPPAPWTRELSSLTNEARVTGLEWALQPNTGALAGFRDVRGYDLPVTHAWEHFARALDPRTHPLWYPIHRVTPANRPLLEFAAVRYVLSDTQQEGLPPVALKHPAPLTVLGLDPSAPRAWLAWQTEPVSDPAAAYTYLRAAQDVRARPPVEPTALVRGRPQRLACPGSSMTAGPRQTALPWLPLHISEPSPERLHIAVSPPRPALLVLADTWARGWEADVDGVARPIWRVGGYFRGVFVRPGDRMVTFRYLPLGWRWGVRGFLIGLAAAGISLVLTRRRRHT